MSEHTLRSKRERGTAHRAAGARLHPGGGGGRATGARAAARQERGEAGAAGQPEVAGRPARGPGDRREGHGLPRDPGAATGRLREGEGVPRGPLRRGGADRDQLAGGDRGGPGHRALQAAAGGGDRRRQGRVRDDRPLCAADRRRGQDPAGAVPVQLLRRRRPRGRARAVGLPGRLVRGRDRAPQLHAAGPDRRRGLRVRQPRPLGREPAELHGPPDGQAQLLPLRAGQHAREPDRRDAAAVPARLRQLAGAVVQNCAHERSDRPRAARRVLLHGHRRRHRRGAGERAGARALHAAGAGADGAGHRRGTGGRVGPGDHHRRHQGRAGALAGHPGRRSGPGQRDPGGGRRPPPRLLRRGHRRRAGRRQGPRHPRAGGPRALPRRRGRAAVAAAGEDVRAAQEYRVERLLFGDLSWTSETSTRPVVDVNAYEDLPTGKTWVSMAFSGDLVAAPYYLSKGLDAEVLRYWFPLDGRGTVGNDLMTVLRSARNPVLAHHFLNFLLDFDMAMLNLEWNGFQPPQVRIDPALLVEQGYIPANLTTAVVRQEYFETGFRAVELDPRVDKSWHGAWSQFKSSL